MDEQLTAFFLRLHACNDFDECWLVLTETIGNLGFSYAAYCYRFDDAHPAGFFYLLLASNPQLDSARITECQLKCVWTKEAAPAESHLIKPLAINGAFTIPLIASGLSGSVSSDIDTVAKEVCYLYQIAMLFDQACYSFPVYRYLNCQRRHITIDFTVKELLTLQWLSQGLSLKQISDQKVHRSIESVNKYISQLKAKLGVQSRAQLIAVATRLRVV